MYITYLTLQLNLILTVLTKKQPKVTQPYLTHTVILTTTNHNLTLSYHTHTELNQRFKL